MSRDASGTYTAPSNSFNPAVEGATIDEGDWNTTLDDIEAALTDSLSISGKGKITAHIDFDETTVSSPAANVGRLYSKDVGGVTSLFFKDNSGTDTNLLLSSPGIAYTFSTSTTMGDPGSGVLRFNNATISSVTAIAIDDNDANGADLSTYVLTWDDNGTSDRGTLLIQNRTSPGNVAIFTISGASTDNSGWTQLAVTYVTHAGSFSTAAPLGVTYLKPGSAGAAGASGPNVGLDYTWSTGTSGDPGTGKVLVNNATPASATQLNISESNRQSASQSAYLATWDDSTTTSARGVVRIMDVSNPGTNFLEYLITGAITDAGSYDTFPVTYIGGAGTIANGTTVAVMHFRTGNVGASTGDVVGPASSVDSEIALFDSTTGKLLKRASTTGVLKAASGVLSAAAATDLGAGLHVIYVPAIAMVSRTTNGAASGAVETTTNKVMLKTLDYDTTTQEFAQFSVRMPKSWNEGTVTAAFTWSHAATTTNFGVVWAIEGVSLSDNDAGDAAFGTAQQIADTGGTTNNIYVTSATPAMTIAGTPAAEDWVVFQIKRVPADGSDTMAIDARLHGVTLYFTTDAITDA